MKNPTWGRRASTVALIGVAALLVCMVAAGNALADAAVAIFSEPDFPYYITSPAVTPEFVRYCLRGAGIGGELVDADALADRGAFNAQRYPVLAHVYGNTFPVAALENLRQFHAAGGCIVAFGGVPFCHPCVREEGKWVDKIDEMGWEFVSHRRMGTGIWGEARDVDMLRHASGDPLGLGWVPLPMPPGGVIQFPRLGMTLEESKALGYDHLLGLPPEDVVVPVVSVEKDGRALGHPVCVIEHGCPQFDGAIDIWAGTTLTPLFTLQQHEQLIIAACAYVLARKGQMTSDHREDIQSDARDRYVMPVTSAPKRKGPFIPRAPRPAERLMVLDVGAMPSEERVLALALQGIVNRKQPRVYLVANFKDRKWLDLLLDQGREQVDCRDLGELVTAFRDEFAGAIIYDPADPHTVNVATSLAGIKQAVVATAELAEKHELPVIEDLRGRFATAAEAYEWVLAEHWPELEQRSVACMSPQWDAPRDYLVQQRMFTFWLDAEVKHQVPAEQMLFFERLLCRMPPHGAVHGWWQEGDEGGIGEWMGVHVSSKYAKITVCTVGAFNLSVHAGGEMPRRVAQEKTPFGSLGKRVYITFIVSDGDNFGMNLYGVIGKLWEQSMRGKVPIGWALCPTQIELSPGAVRYWYETASENDFFLTMDGLGYVYPDVYGQALGDPERYYGEFLRQTQSYMRRLGHEHLWYLGGSSRAEQMARVLGLDGLFGEYGVPPEQRHELIGETAAIWIDVNPWEKPYADVDVLIERIRKRTPEERPAFLFVGTNGFTVGPNEVARILTELGPEYIAVRPDELCHLFRKYKRKGVDENPEPRPSLDLTLPPPPGPHLTDEGILVVREDDGNPDISGWHTDPRGTQWVRKRLAIPLPADAAKATIYAMVRGNEGARVTFRVNGHEHRVRLRSSAWHWVSVEVEALELMDGGNEIWYTGNPEARLFVAGDATINVGHSDFGSADHWSMLSGELMCYVEVR